MDSRGAKLREVLGGIRQKVPLARFLTLVTELVDTGDVKNVARDLGMSESHVRNLVRVKRLLAPEAWALVEEGDARGLKEWIRIAALTPREQRREVAGRKSA